MELRLRRRRCVAVLRQRWCRARGGADISAAALAAVGLVSLVACSGRSSEPVDTTSSSVPATQNDRTRFDYALNRMAIADNNVFVDGTNPAGVRFSNSDGSIVCQFNEFDQLCRYTSARKPLFGVDTQCDAQRGQDPASSTLIGWSNSWNPTINPARSCAPQRAFVNTPTRVLRPGRQLQMIIHYKNTACGNLSDSIVCVLGTSGFSASTSEFVRW